MNFAFVITNLAARQSSDRQLDPVLQPSLAPLSLGDENPGSSVCFSRLS